MIRLYRQAPCPNCGRTKDARAKLCHRCAGAGAPLSTDPNTIYARELGVRTRTVLALGGHEKLRALAPEVRALMLKPFCSATRRPRYRGGMAALGMKSMVPARLTQPDSAPEVSA